MAAAALAVLASSGGNGSNAPAASPLGVEPAADAAPDVRFEMIDGSTRSFADFRGKPLVVNFFASWCVPCLAEMPGFERVHQGLGDRVGFLGLNLQDRLEDGLSVIERTGITYPVARDPSGELFRAFGGFAMPTTVFVGADGRVVDLHSGEIGASELRKKIERELLS